MKVGELLECVEAVPGLLTAGRLYEVLDCHALDLELAGVRTDDGETRSLGTSYFREVPPPIAAEFRHLVHVGHGTAGGDNPDCACRDTAKQADCYAAGCPFCWSPTVADALSDLVRLNGLLPAEADLVRAEAAAHDRTVGAQLARIVGDWCRATQSGALYERATSASSTPPGDGSWSGSTP